MFCNGYKANQVDFMDSKNKNDFLQELIDRGLSGGILPRSYVVVLCETLHMLEENQGATHAELYRKATSAGFHAKSMSWILACLAIIGLVRLGENRNGTETWFTTY